MTGDAKERRGELEERLRSVSEQFERNMRARGFDPAQAENSALPNALAELYQERQLLQAELNELDSTDSTRAESVEN